MHFTQQNVLMTLKHRPSVIINTDGHTVWRLCGDRLTDKPPRKRLDAYLLEKLKLLTVDYHRKTKLALPSLFSESKASRFDAPVSHAIHSPDKKMLRSGFRFCLKRIHIKIIHIYSVITRAQGVLEKAPP